MHRSRHPMDISLVVDDDNDEEGGSPEHFIPSSTTSDYSSLIVNSPPDTMYHRHRSPSPSPTSSSYSMNHRHHATHPSPTQGSQSNGNSATMTTATTSARPSRQRFLRSASMVDLNASAPNIHRDRIRFSTWPRHRKEKRDILVEHDKRLAKSVIQELGIGINKTYRNPWGNLSYAQLITRAIDSSPWKRLTLNEVYEWIIKFVPYFKDKIDAKTSWGWKNSIRHNLSLHNQFIRVPIISSQSKGPVKYVWTINPSFKNNSPYKKYSLKRKRAAAAAALASQTAAAAAASTLNSNSSSQEHRSPTSTPSQGLLNMSNNNNYHRQSNNNPNPSASSSSSSSASTANVAKATHHGDHHAQGNGSSTLNQLSVAAAMMSAGVTDPAAYRAFLNSQAAAMMNKHKQQTSCSSPSSSSSPISHRPSPSNGSSYSHESGLPIPKKVALASDRYKQPQAQHPDWLLASYRQNTGSAGASQPPPPPPPPPPYNGRHTSSKMHMNHQQQHQRSPYLPHPQSATRLNAEMANLSPSLQRRVSSPPNYPSAAALNAAAAQSKILAQTKLWHAAVQAAAAQAHQQQQYHHHQAAAAAAAQPSINAINELQNYINRSNPTNGNPTKIPSYLSPEALKLLQSASNGGNPAEETHPYASDPRYKFMRASYPNTASMANSNAIPSACLIRQRMNPHNPNGLTTQQQIDMVTAAYQNYRRRSSGFSSTASHGGPSDDESDEFIPPRKDSSTSNVSSGYESGLPISRQSPSATSSSVRTGSGSSITSEAASSPYYPHVSNGSHPSMHNRSRKTPLNGSEIDIDEHQQLALNSAGGYVDDLMERIRKMPPKKRSKFYQMLDEERLKDVNNNHPDDPNKSKEDEIDEEEHEHPIAMDVSARHSDDEDDRTLTDVDPKNPNVPSDEHERKEKFQQALETLSGLNEKALEELFSMDVPLAVLKALVFQPHQTETNGKSNSPLSAFLSKKCSLNTGKSSTSKANLLNARTILQKILKQQKHGPNEKSMMETMDYTSEEEAGLLVDEDEEKDGRQSSSVTPRHRNGIRSNSHNPVPVTLNPNDISSLSPPTSTSSSPDETDVPHHSSSSPNSISRPSSTPATLVTSACPY